MRNKKLAAFTIIEVTMAMLLSVICMGICYSAYTLIEKYFSEFQRQQKATSELLEFAQVLRRDVDGADAVLLDKDGRLLGLQTDSSAIQYFFLDSICVRDLNRIKRDTFWLKTDSVSFGFEGRPASVLVDEISVTVVAGSSSNPLKVKKWYSSATLMKVYGTQD